MDRIVDDSERVSRLIAQGTLTAFVKGRDRIDELECNLRRHNIYTVGGGAHVQLTFAPMREDTKLPSDMRCVVVNYNDAEFANFGCDSGQWSDEPGRRTLEIATRNLDSSVTVSVDDSDNLLQIVLRVEFVHILNCLISPNVFGTCHELGVTIPIVS